MYRFASILAIPLLGAAAALASGCANSASSIVSGGNANLTTAASPGPANREFLARAAQVASTAARAQICGLAFDAAKLRASYLAYETKQGLDNAQLSMIEKNYDTSLSTVTAQGAAIASRCSAQQVAWTRDRNAEFSQKYKEELEAELRRYVTGAFTPDGKKPYVGEPFETKAFWKDQDDG